MFGRIKLCYGAGGQGAGVTVDQASSKTKLEAVVTDRCRASKPAPYVFLVTSDEFTTGEEHGPSASG